MRRPTWLHRTFSVGASALGATLATAACGPIEYIAATPMTAAGAVGEAHHARADDLAPYEMTAAREYLHKSRELAGYARFQSSVEFARKATRLAREGRAIAVERGGRVEPRPDDAPPPREAAPSPHDHDTPAATQRAVP